MLTRPPLKDPADRRALDVVDELLGTLTLLRGGANALGDDPGPHRDVAEPRRGVA